MTSEPCTYARIGITPLGSFVMAESALVEDYWQVRSNDGSNNNNFASRPHI